MGAKVRVQPVSGVRQADRPHSSRDEDFITRRQTADGISVDHAADWRKEVNIEKHTPIEVFYLPQTSTPVKLVEGNRWGVSRGHGKNTLGKLIMEQRQNLRVTSELPGAESVL